MTEVDRQRIQLETKSVSAQNLWTDPVFVRGSFNASAVSTFPNLTVVALQRCPDYEPSLDTGTWREVNRWTMDGSTGLEITDEDEAGAWYRIGVPTGGYVSGTNGVSLWRQVEL